MIKNFNDFLDKYKYYRKKRDSEEKKEKKFYNNYKKHMETAAVPCLCSSNAKWAEYLEAINNTSTHQEFKKYRGAKLFDDFLEEHITKYSSVSSFSKFDALDMLADFALHEKKITINANQGYFRIGGAVISSITTAAAIIGTIIIGLTINETTPLSTVYSSMFFIFVIVLLYHFLFIGISSIKNWRLVSRIWWSGTYYHYSKRLLIDIKLTKEYLFFQNSIEPRTLSQTHTTEEVKPEV